MLQCSSANKEHADRRISELISVLLLLLSLCCFARTGGLSALVYSCLFYRAWSYDWTYWGTSIQSALTTNGCPH